MRRLLGTLAVIGILGVMITAPALAAEEGATHRSAWDNKTIYFVAVVIVAGVIMVIAEVFAVRGQTRAIETALKAIARQPNAVKSIQTNLIIGLALIESLAIYVLLIAIILLMANPFEKVFI